MVTLSMASPVSYPPPHWEPHSGKFHEIVDILGRAVSPDNSVQENVLDKISQIKALPDAVEYFATILCTQNINLNTRQLAGLTLKNIILENHNSLNLLSRNYLKTILTDTLKSPEKAIQNTVGSVITSLISTHGARTWLDILHTLVESLSSNDDNLFEGSISTLSKIVEDAHNNIYGDPEFVEFCKSEFLPKLFTICDFKSSQTRQNDAFSCIMKFAHTYTFAPHSDLTAFFPQFWMCLGKMGASPNTKIRRLVVEGMSKILRTQPEEIFDSSDIIISFMIECSCCDDYELKQEAVDFWIALLQTPTFFDSENEFHLREQLPRLLNILVNNTIYAEKDYFSMDPSQFGENATSPDLPQDIQPRFSKTEDEPDSDYDEDMDVFYRTWGMQWTLRKGSAMTLDILSFTFRSEVLQIVLPLIERNFAHTKWEIRESAVLTLGAIAIGTISDLSPYLPGVLPHLLVLCDDRVPLLRSITCWCLSRFGQWICSANNYKQWLEPVLLKILKCMSDTNKSVQEAACSSFAVLEDEAREYLIPFLDPILNTLITVFNLYQAKNLLILYDAIGTLAEWVDYSLNKNNKGAKLMELMIKRWMLLSDNDPAVIAICECMTCCAKALRHQFYPLPAPLITESMRRINLGIAEIDQYNSQVISCCLNLLSSITEALESEMANLLINHPNLNFIYLLEICCGITLSGVLQSAFALVGDLSKHCIVILKPHLHTIIPELSKHLLDDAISVSNNAGWAIGQITMKVTTEEINPFLDAIISQLVKLLQNTHLHKSLIQNGCLTIGRLGIVSPKKMSIILPDIFRHWCLTIRATREDDEKCLAFEGMCNMIMERPDVAAQNLAYFCDAIISTPTPFERQHTNYSEKLHEQFRIILNGIREYYPNHWNETWNNMLTDKKEELTRRFGV